MQTAVLGVILYKHKIIAPFGAQNRVTNMDNIYDLIIIGGGPAGYSGAVRAAQNGLKTLLFEKCALGGVCLNEGCIPSKTLLNSAKIFGHALDGSAFGVLTDNVKFDWQAVQTRREKVIKRLVTAIKAELRSSGAETVVGEANIVGNADGVFSISCEGSVYYAKNLLISTGSVPSVPPIEGLKEALESGTAVTNKGILQLSERPSRLTVIGGGVIGLEMAYFYASIGSEVTVIEALPEIGGNLSADAKAVLKKSMEKKGVKFITSARVTKVNGKSVTYTTSDAEGIIEGNVVLVSVGRKADTQSIGLENIGVKCERGFAVTDNTCKTSVDGVYCAGDARGGIMLAHAAYKEAEVAVDAILGKASAVNPDLIPSVVYTYPEVAAVGISEEEAQKRGINYKVGKVSLMTSGRYIAENTELTGYCKLIADTTTNVLIGGEIVGSYAGELITVITALVTLKTDIEVAKSIVFPHPTVAEAIKEALKAL